MAAPQPVQGYTNNTPLTVMDFMERGLSREDAQHRVNQLVFGHDYKSDANGVPIEQGKGSAAQPTPQHLEALSKEAERQAMMGQHLTPDKIGAAVAAAMKGTSGITPEMIAAAVTAALASGSGPLSAKPKRKYQRRAKPAAEPQEAA